MLIFGWMELDTERGSTVCKGSNDFACLRVPQVYQFVEARGKELSAIISEADISDCLCVTLVSTNALSMSCRVPNLARSIVTR